MWNMAAGQSRGTILPAPNFHAERSAIKLQKSMKGIGTDEKVIIEVLTSHSNHQRQEIKKKYKALYGRDLNDDLKSELSGHFETVCLALLTPHDKYLVQSLHTALKGPGTDEACLIDILCIQMPNEIETLTTLYKEKYGEELENDIKEDASGRFKTMVRSLLSGGREEFPAEDEDAVNLDAQDLIEAARSGKAEEFAAKLNTRSFAQLRKVLEVYPKVSGKDIEEDIKSLFGGDGEFAYTSLAKMIKSDAEYFAERLHSSLKGLGTDDLSVIRILVTHSETDLADIKEKFKNNYNKELSDIISEDTSGDYRKMLLKILG